MADEIKKDSAAAPEKKSKKENKPEAPKKKKNVFASMGKNIKKFFKDLRGECKKVVWPDSKTVLKSGYLCKQFCQVFIFALYYNEKRL